MKPVLGDLKQPRICFIVASPETAAAFLNPHIEALSDHYEVDVVANFSCAPSSVSSKARHIDIPVERKLNLLHDLKALRRLRRLFLQGNYSTIHSITPKAGLLAMTAGRLARIPNRLHWFTGQVWVTRTGVSRRLLKRADRLTAQLATAVLVDSPSQMTFLTNERVLRSGSATVLGDGSICGVDTERFRPNQQARTSIRNDLAIKPDDVVILYVGRINPDKGLDDLAQALSIMKTRDRVRLIVAGTDEARMIPAITHQLSTSGLRFSFVGPTSSPEELMAAADIFCMPSHREGFGLSVIEASACSLPSVASAIYGLTDAVEDGVTGLLFPVGDRRELARCLQMLVDDAELRLTLGRAGRQRVIAKFSQHRVTSELVNLYQQLPIPSGSPVGRERG
jgi:glycosyltransferase involved in cell wall biosynthesis